jgi:hypothetical protein
MNSVDICFEVDLKYDSDRGGGRKKRKNVEGNQQEPNVPHQ